MFLERYKHSHQRNLSSPIKQMKFTHLMKVLKNVSIPEIKKHQKKSNYFNPRTYLIENAKKVIKTMKKEPDTTPQGISQRNQKTCGKDRYHHLSCNHTESHISSRQARQAAIKNIHQRIWKSNDITFLLQGKEQKHFSHSKTSNKRDNKDLVDTNLERIEPYLHFIEEFDLSFHNYRREHIKKDGALASPKNHQNIRKDSAHKNPEQTWIGSVPLKDHPEDSLMNNYKLLIGDRRKQPQRTSSHIPRPNTTGGYKHQRSDENDQNIIEPW